MDQEREGSGNECTDTQRLGGTAMVCNKGESAQGVGDGLKRKMQINKSRGANVQ